jgi:hypothetical protein
MIWRRLDRPRLILAHSLMVLRQTLPAYFKPFRNNSA